MSDNPGSVDLGSAHGKIVIDFSQVGQQFDSAINGVQQTVSSRLQNMGGRLQSFGRKWSLATLPIAGFLLSGVKAFGEFDDILTEIEARTGATADEMELIRQVALDMGRDTAFSATQASQAMLEMLSSGSSLEETMAGLPHVLNLAAAGNIELGRSADAVTDILAQFQLDMKDSEMVVNALAAASQSSSATIPDLIAAFQNVGPVANAFGLSIEETAAALAVFAENGIKGSESGTQLRSMLNNMARDTNETEAAWTSLGTSMFDAEGQMRPLNDVIADINAGLADKTPQEQQKIIRDLAGTYGQMGLTALLASEGIEDMQDSMDESASASDLAAAKMRSFRGRTRQLMSTLSTLSIKIIGPLVEKYLEPLVVTVTDVLNKFGVWADENPKLAEALGLILVALVALGPLLIGLGTGMQAAGFAMKGLNMISLASIGPWLLLIAALVALGVAYKKNLFGFADAVDKVFKDIQPALEAVVGWIDRLVDAFETGGLQGAFDFLIGEFENLKDILSSIDWMALGEQGVDLLSGLWAAFKPQANEAIQLASDWLNIHILQPIIDELQAVDWIALVSEVINLLGRLWEAFKPPANAALKFAADWIDEYVIGPVVDYISDIDWRQVAGQGIDLLNSLWGWITSQAVAGGNIAADWINAHVLQPILDKLKSIDWMALGGQGIDLASSLLSWLGDQAVAGGNIAADWLNAHVLQPIVNELQAVEWMALGGQGVDLVNSLLSWLGDQAGAGGTIAADWLNAHVLQPIVDYISNIDWGALANQGINFIGGLLSWLAGQGEAGGAIVKDWVNDHIIQPILNELGLSSGDIQGAGNFLADIFDAIASGAVDALQWVKDNIYTPISDALDDVDLGTVGDFLEDLFGAIATCVVNVAAWINDNIITPISNGLDQVDWEEIGCFIGDIFDAIAAEAPDVAQWIIDNIISPIGNALANADWSQIADAAKTFFEGLWNEIKEHAPEVADWVWDNIAVPIKDGIADINWSSISGELSDFGAGLFDALGDAYDFAAGAVSWVDDNIIGPIGDALSSAGDFIGLGGGDEEGGAPSASATAQQINDLERLQQWFDDNSQGVLDKITGLKDAISDFIDRANRVWDATQDAWNNLKANIPDSTQPGIDIVIELKDEINTFIERANRVWDATQSAWNNLKVNIPDSIQPGIDIIMELSDVIDQFVEQANRIWAATQSAWNNLKANIPNSTQPGIDKINELKDAANSFVDRANRVWDATQGAWNNLQVGIPNAMATIISAFRDAASEADRLTYAVERLTQRLYQLQRVGPVPIQVTGSVPSGAPGLQHGGMVGANQPHFVGERGIELLVPKSSGMVVSNSQLMTAMNALGQGGGSTIQIDNLEISVPEMDTNDPREAGRQIAQSFEQQLRELMRSRG